MKHLIGMKNKGGKFCRSIVTSSDIGRVLAWKYVQGVKLLLLRALKRALRDFSVSFW
jgi:hypothetical protein